MELLDFAIIDEVRDALGDEAYRGYAERMLTEMHGVSPALDAHLRAGEFEALAQAAHRAAGSAVSVGAKGLHAALKRIEDVARQADAGTALPPLVAGLAGTVGATEAALDALTGGA